MSISRRLACRLQAILPRFTLSPHSHSGNGPGVRYRHLQNAYCSPFVLVRAMKSVALLAAVWIGLTALCVWLVANNKIQAWDLYAILFALVLIIAVSFVIMWR